LFVPFVQKLFYQLANIAFWLAMLAMLLIGFEAGYRAGRRSVSGERTQLLLNSNATSSSKSPQGYATRPAAVKNTRSWLDTPQFVAGASQVCGKRTATCIYGGAGKDTKKFSRTASRISTNEIATEAF